MRRASLGGLCRLNSCFWPSKRTVKAPARCVFRLLPRAEDSGDELVMVEGTAALSSSARRTYTARARIVELQRHPRLQSHTSSALLL